ncbi:uncharacterized protein LOC119773994 [Cyprinodon tularosa]|uniref:uncharacterized protein LOC119773994 n=1 Tax=Cyprinodon tularosa TaxID=77115 RepID=UPI0018E21DA9|nr:uncharacterized protein LOC119773994 [Cyprinodon tularosa]
MKVCYTLICILFLTLQDGETVETYRGTEGGSITVRCEFKNSGSRRFLCKETCEGRNILINTNEDMFQSGRYSIRYDHRGKSNYLIVSITKLKKSDSGRYQCRLDHSSYIFWTESHCDDFILSVTEDSSEPKWTLGPFIRSTFLPAASTTTTTTQSLSSSPSPSSSETSRVSEKPAAASGLLLYVGLILSILIIILAAALLIFFKRKSFRQQKVPPVKAEYGDMTTVNTVYEEIREQDTGNKPRPGELASVYVYANNFIPKRDESTDIYSLASGPDNEVEGEVNYSEVHLSHPASPNSAPCGREIDIYSEPRKATISAINNDSPPLYSTVTLKQ